MSEKKPDDELLNWMDSFRNHVDVGESTVIYKTLKENKFGTRMQIKLQTLKENKFRACSYGQKLSRLPRKHFDKFTSEISPCYEII